MVIPSFYRRTFFKNTSILKSPKFCGQKCKNSSKIPKIPYFLSISWIWAECQRYLNWFETKYDLKFIYALSLDRFKIDVVNFLPRDLVKTTRKTTSKNFCGSDGCPLWFSLRDKVEFERYFQKPFLICGCGVGWTEI